MTREPQHAPVLVEEALGYLRAETRGVFVDCTVGLGGHAEALLRRMDPGSFLHGFDRDAESLERARGRLAPFEGRFALHHADFRTAPAVLGPLLPKAGRSAPAAGSRTWGSRWTSSRRRSAASPSRGRALWT